MSYELEAAYAAPASTFWRRWRHRLARFIRGAPTVAALMRELADATPADALRIGRLYDIGLISYDGARRQAVRIAERRRARINAVRRIDGGSSER